MTAYLFRLFLSCSRIKFLSLLSNQSSKLVSFFFLLFFYRLLKLFNSYARRQFAIVSYFYAFQYFFSNFPLTRHRSAQFSLLCEKSMAKILLDKCLLSGQSRRSSSPSRSFFLALPRKSTCTRGRTLLETRSKSTLTNEHFSFLLFPSKRPENGVGTKL